MAARHPHVNEAVIAAVNAAGLRPVQLAQLVGTSESNVSRWLAGASSPDPDIWPALERVLGVKLALRAEVSWQAEVAELKQRVAELERQVATLLPSPRVLKLAADTTGGSTKRPRKVGGERTPNRPQPPAPSD